MFWMLAPCQIHSLQIFFLILVGRFFILLMVSLAMQKLFSLMLSHLFIFVFIAFVFGVRLKKLLSRCRSRNLPSLLSSRSLIVSGMMVPSSL